MARRIRFQALAPELVGCAEAISVHFGGLGYSLRAEKFDIGFPSVPTLHCSRKPIVLLVDIVDGVDLTRVMAWVAFCRAAPTDTRFAVGMSSQTVISQQHIDHLRQHGVGLYIANGNGVTESLAPADQGMQDGAAAIPALDDLHRSVKEVLGPAYEKIRRGEWREGFQEACEALEDSARAYLKKWSRTGRIRVQRKKGAHTLAGRHIEKMTMGQLAKAFSEIISPNKVDTVIGLALDAVVTDRNLLIHKRRRAITERRLRRHWKGHMWEIVGALKVLHS